MRNEVSSYLFKDQMVKNIIFFLHLFLFSNFVKSQHLREFDFAKEISLQNKKPTVIYFTATWCLPCMKKLLPILDSLKNHDEYNFYVVVERTHYEKIIPLIIQHNYHDSIFKVIDWKYYQQFANRAIQINIPFKAFKNLANEIDSVFHIGKAKQEILWGNSMIFNKEKFYCTASIDNVQDLTMFIKNNLINFQNK